MELPKIKRILRWLDGTDIEEIEVREGENSLRITRRVAPKVASGSPTESPSFPQRPEDIHMVSPRSPLDPREAQDQLLADPPNKQYQVVQSPIVGTFYAASVPDSPTLCFGR